jgi:hypothetical protein
MSNLQLAVPVAAPRTWPSPLKVDLGAGQNKREGFLGLDRAPVSDITHDLLDTPWPFADESVDELHASHVLEHFWGEDQIKIIDEAYRVLKYAEADGSSATGTLTVIVPWWNSVRQWQDPTHKAPFPDNKALYFNKPWRVANKLDHYEIKSDFDFTLNYQLVDPANGVKGYVSASREAQLFALYYYANVVGDLTVVFRKVKRT